MFLLVNISFIVIGSGKFFRNVQFDFAVNLGIVKVDSDGAGYYIFWGLINEVVFIFEFSVYFFFYCERIKVINGKDRVIMYCYVINLIVFIYVFENDIAVFIR